MGDPTGDAMRFETAAVHAGQDPEPVYGAVNVPIYQNATYAQEAVGNAIKHGEAKATAKKTRAMPPCPSCLTIRYGPMRSTLR